MARRLSGVTMQQAVDGLRMLQKEQMLSAGPSRSRPGYEPYDTDAGGLSRPEGASTTRAG
jgi:hypothetical protein